MTGWIEYQGKRYPVDWSLEIAEDGSKRYAAWLVDFPGCITVGATLIEVHGRLQALAEPFFSAMIELGNPLPEPTELPAIIAGPVGFYNAETGRSFVLGPGEMTERLIGAPDYTYERLST
jgi:predicted RNase H-like HicB family nuclease